MADADYAQSIEAWRADLDSEIRREDGPLTLVGLFWLQNGINTVGSSRDCTMCLPKPAPRLMGAFEYDGRQLLFRGDIGQAAQLDGIPVEPGARMQLRMGASPSRVTLGGISMAPIQFGAKLGIQVRDRSLPGLTSYPPRNWYKVDSRFLVQGTYTPYPAPVQLSMPDSLGGIQTGYAQGYVSFKLEGKSSNLDATEGDDGRLFVQFRDQTNGVQTYSEGRFLHSAAVSEDGGVVLDFNRAFNPEAAFTKFGLCTLPPRRHVLNVHVEAGEAVPLTPAEWP